MSAMMTIQSLELSCFYFLSCQPGLLLHTMKVKVKSLSCIRLFATPWTVAYQAPPSMEFSRQEYWTGLPFLSPGDLPDPRTWVSPSLQADSLPSEPPGKPCRFRYGGLLAKSGLTLVTPWTGACQTPLYMGFSNQKYWTGLPFLSPGDLPNLGIESRSPALQADSLPTEPPGKPMMYSA